MKIYVYKDQNQTGPFSEQGIRDMISRRELSLDDLAWHDGLKDWEPIEAVFQFDKMPPPPPLLKSPQRKRATPLESAQTPSISDRPKGNLLIWMIAVAILLAVGFLGYEWFQGQNASAPSGATSQSSESKSEPVAQSIQYSEKAKKEIIIELKKLNSLTEMGINYTEYSRKVIEAKPTIDNLLLSCKDQEFNTLAKIVLSIYVDTYKIWNLITTERYGQPTLTTEQVAYYTKRYTINGKFILPFHTNADGETWADKETITTMWKFTGLFTHALDMPHDEQVKLLNSTDNDFSSLQEDDEFGRAPTPKVDLQGGDSIKSQKAILAKIKNIGSRTGSGISYEDFQQELTDMRPTIAVLVPQCKNKDFVLRLSGILGIYVDTSNLWKLVIQDKDGKPKLTEEQVTNLAKYSGAGLDIIRTDSTGDKWVDQKSIGSLMSAAAALTIDLEKASNE